MKKIMFNDRYGLTEAVLSGRKTQTRRMEINYSEQADVNALVVKGYKPYFRVGYVVTSNSFGSAVFAKKIRYKVGEVVAVAQSYKDAGYNRGTYWDKNYRDENNRMPIFMANEEPMYVNPAGWLNKMFVKAEYMPHHIRITGIRVERLQDISDEDCIKEGIFEDGGDDAFLPHYFYDYPNNRGNGFNTPRDAYAALINKVSGEDTWFYNPWMVVYDFSLVD